MADWVFDSLVGFLRSPVWNCPVNSFIDTHCVVFDPGEECKFSYTDIHTEYSSLVDKLLEDFVTELGITPEQLAEVCSPDIKVDKHVQVLFDQLYAGDDFLIFKSMMVQHNIDLELQALSLIQKQLGHAPEAYIPHALESMPPKPQLHQSEEEDDKVFAEVLRLSKEEYEKQLISDAEAEMLLTLAKEESLRLYQISQQEQKDLLEKLAKRALGPAPVDEGKVMKDTLTEPPKLGVTKGKEGIEDLRSSEKLPLVEQEQCITEPSKQTIKQMQEAPVKDNQPHHPPPRRSAGKREHVGHSGLTSLNNVKKEGISTGFNTGESTSVMNAEMSGSEAAQKWLESARSEIDNEQGRAEKIMVQVPEDLKYREVYLRRQRDRLLEARRKEREKTYGSYGSFSMPQRGILPRKDKISASESRDKGNEATPSQSEMTSTPKRDYDTGVLCSTIAAKLNDADEQ